MPTTSAIRNCALPGLPELTNLADAGIDSRRADHCATRLGHAPDPFQRFYIEQRCDETIRGSRHYTGSSATAVRPVRMLSSCTGRPARLGARPHGPVGGAGPDIARAFDAERADGWHSAGSGYQHCAGIYRRDRGRQENGGGVSLSPALVTRLASFQVGNDRRRPSTRGSDLPPACTSNYAGSHSHSECCAPRRWAMCSSSAIEPPVGAICS